MIRLLVLFAALFACGARAQSTNSTPAPNTATNAPASQQGHPSLESEAATTASVDLLELRPAKANEIAKGNLIFSGISVEVVKTHRPLELFNPMAPAQYGSPEDNVVRNPSNGHVSGLKFFAIRF